MAGSRRKDLKIHTYQTIKVAYILRRRLPTRVLMCSMDHDEHPNPNLRLSGA